MARIDAFLKLAYEQRASDLHFVSGTYPFIRFNGDLYPINFRRLSSYDGESFLYEILTDKQKATFEEKLELDFSYYLKGIAHFRVNMFMQKDGVGAVFRLIPDRIRTIEELKLPKALKRFAYLQKGLVLVTGPTGSGKSTTLAAIIDEINRNEKKHIITIEDPIEFVHQPKKSLISQREVHTHVESFASGLKSALREAPDVVLVGEMRDLETIALTLTCAETGVLVFATLHTGNVVNSIDRIVDVFPSEQQDQIRTMLSVTLQGVASQQLLKTADGLSRIAAVEILTATYALANIIREGKTHQIYTLIQASDYEETGMQTLDEHLIRLIEEKEITAREAITRAVDPELFKPYLERETQSKDIYLD